MAISDIPIALHVLDKGLARLGAGLLHEGSELMISAAKRPLTV